MSNRAIATVRSVATSAGPKIVAAGRVNTIGLAQRDLNELLEKLDHRENPGALGPVRRDFARWPFRQASVVLKLVHPGGTEVELRLACRNLSRGGTCMLHNGFLHTGTACRVQMPRVSGGFEDIPGVICRCQHRRGTLHEIGVKFDHPVNLKRFIPGEPGAEVYSLERVAPEKLKGRLLLVDECPMSVRIVHHYLRETELVVTHFKSGAEALAEASTSFDIVLVAAALPDMKGLEFVSKLREAGVQSPVMLMSTDEGLAATANQQGDGNLGVLVKPLQHDMVLRALAERLLVSSQPSAAGKPPASAARKPAVGPELLAELVRTSAALRKAAAEGNVAKALPLCLILKGAAGAVEHAAFSAAANKAVAAMTGPEDASRFAVVEQLCKVCDSAFAVKAAA